MPEEEVVAPTMSVAEAEAYKEELKGELLELEKAQVVRYSKYKAERIARLQQRLGIPAN